MSEFLLRRPATAFLLAANLLLYLPAAVPVFGIRHEPLLAWGDLSARALWRGEAWRLLSCLFLHANLVHFLCNMAVLVRFGTDLEGRLGTARFALLYLLAGLAGDLASVLLLPAEAPTVGASGALFGVAGAHLALEMERGRSPAAFLELAGGRTLVFFVLANLALGFTIPFVNNGAHLGGLLGGFAATRVLLSGRFVRPPAGAWTLRAAGLLFALELSHYALFPFARPAWHEARALTRIEAGRPAEAEGPLRVALLAAERRGGGEPWRAAARHALLGYALAGAGRWEEAAGELARAGNDPFAGFWEAAVLRRLGREREAREVLDAAERTASGALLGDTWDPGPEGAQALQALVGRLRGAHALLRTARGGDPAAVRREVDRILGAEPRSAEGLLARGVAALRAGDRAGAAACAALALATLPRDRLDPDDPPILPRPDLSAEATRLLARARGRPVPPARPPHPLFE